MLGSRRRALRADLRHSARGAGRRAASAAQTLDQAKKARGGGSSVDRIIDGRLPGSGRALRSATGSTASSSTSAPGKTAAGAGVAQSGVQQPIFSWSGAIPSSAPAIVQLTDGAALAAPGLPIIDSAIRMATMSFITILIHVCWATRKAAPRVTAEVGEHPSRGHVHLLPEAFPLCRLRSMKEISTFAISPPHVVLPPLEGQALYLLQRPQISLAVGNHRPPLPPVTGACAASCALMEPDWMTCGTEISKRPQRARERTNDAAARCRLRKAPLRASSLGAASPGMR